jgi:hypothetical protein
MKKMPFFGEIIFIKLAPAGYGADLSDAVLTKSVEAFHQN